MKEILIIIGVIFLYIAIGEFVNGFGGSDDDDILSEIICVAAWPLLLCIFVTAFVFIKIIDPIISNPFSFMKKLGRKLGEKIWRK
jgi:hypothetical protein